MSESDFDPREAGRFPDSAQIVIRMAQGLDWHLRWQNNRHHVLNFRSPDGVKTFVLPTTNIRASRIESAIQALYNHSDRKKFGELLAGTNDLRKDPALARIVTLLGTAVAVDAAQKVADREAAVMERVAQKVADVAQSVETEWEKYTAKGTNADRYGADWWVRIREDGTRQFECRAHETPIRTSLDGMGGHQRAHFNATKKRDQIRSVPDDVKDVVRRAGKRSNTRSGVASKVVSDTALNEGKRNESPYTRIRVYENGTVEYYCREGDYVHEKAFSVAAHARNTHQRNGEGDRMKRPTPKGAKVPLADGLREALARTPEPAGPNDALQRIRELLGEDSRLAEKDAQIERLTRERDEAIRLGEKAAADLAALKELVRSI